MPANTRADHFIRKAHASHGSQLGSYLRALAKSAAARRNTRRFSPGSKGYRKWTRRAEALLAQATAITSRAAKQGRFLPPMAPRGVRVPSALVNSISANL